MSTPMMSVDIIIENPHYVRGFDLDAIYNLAKDIMGFGLVRPITVVERERKGLLKWFKKRTYTPVDGTIRLRACKLLQWKEVPVRIVFRDAFIEFINTARAV